MVHLCGTEGGLQGGMLTWWGLLGLLSWYPPIQSSHCNSFEDQVPVDEIYGYPIFKWVVVTWQLWQGNRIVTPALATTLMLPLVWFASLNIDWGIPQYCIGSWVNCHALWDHWLKEFLPHFHRQGLLLSCTKGLWSSLHLPLKIHHLWLCMSTQNVAGDWNFTSTKH